MDWHWVAGGAAAVVGVYLLFYPDFATFWSKGGADCDSIRSRIRANISQ